MWMTVDVLVGETRPRAIAHEDAAGIVRMESHQRSESLGGKKGRVLDPKCFSTPLQRSPKSLDKAYGPPVLLPSFHTNMLNSSTEYLNVSVSLKNTRP